VFSETLQSGFALPPGTKLAAVRETGHHHPAQRCAASLTLLSILWSLNMKGKDAAKTSMDPINIMTVRELSAYLNVHTSTIYRMLKQRQLPAFQVGSDWRFSIAAIDHWRLQQEEPK
jgi:excisionase family DNA binding protein